MKSGRKDRKRRRQTTFGFDNGKKISTYFVKLNIFVFLKSNVHAMKFDG